MSPQQARNILLVEDDPDDAELTTIGLERRKLANRLVIASAVAELGLYWAVLNEVP
jgi:hypothetical protein